MSTEQRGRAEVARQTVVRVIAAGFVAILLAATACSGEPGASSPSPIPDTGGTTPSATVTSSPPSPSDQARYPNLSGFTDPFDRLAYESAYSDCGLLGVDRMAEGFGGDPDDPPSVARAYAAATFPESVEHRDATSQGCLDGFKAATQ
jgi:hypothetical protein